MKREAIRMVLSGKLADKELLVLENNDFKENKTKEAAAVLNKIDLKGSVLWTFDKGDSDKTLASRNLENVENISVDNLNVYDMLNKKYLIVTKKGIKNLEEKYSKDIDKENEAPKKAEKDLK
jgi:large subunit ribosomal protein L4